MTPTTLILRTAGTNCDRELAYAFELAGAQTETIHLNALIEKPSLVEQFDLIGVPGGFSYGDDIAAGRIFANRLKHRLAEPLRDAAQRGVPMIGPCNGFQVLVKLGLLPDPMSGAQQATLADNTAGRFIDRWVGMVAPSESVCIWTKGLDAFDLPIAHGEGRFTAPEATIAALEAAGQVAVRYASDDNPNGSVNDIAGICDPTGVILGLMPHPERFIASTNHPQWTRKDAAWREAVPAGLKFFQNAVAHVQAKAEAGTPA